MRNAQYRNVISVLTFFLLCTGLGHAQIKTIRPSSKFVTKEIKSITSLTGIRLQGNPDVEYRQSKNGETVVYVYAPENITDLVETTVSNEILQIRIKDHVKISGKAGIRILVSSPQLNTIEITGSGDVFLPGTLTTDKLQISINGSGDVTGDNLQCGTLGLTVQGSGDIGIKRLKATHLNALVNGSGDLNLVGAAQNISFTINGSGDITAERLVAQNVKISISGSGDITCYPVQKLEAQVSGSGDVSYVGAPKQILLKGNKHHIRKMQ